VVKKIFRALEMVIHCSVAKRRDLFKAYFPDLVCSGFAKIFERVDTSFNAGETDWSAFV
jgi:hypothetical protein